MVLRTFLAFDSENLVVTSSNNSSLVGNPIINNGNTPNGTIFQYTAGSAQEITLNDTRGGSNVFNDGQPNQHRIVDGKGLVNNGTGVESESIIRLRELDADGNQAGPVITLNVYSQNGNFSDIWGYSTTSQLQNGSSYVKVSGVNNGSSAYTTFITCFAEDTQIATPDGQIAVQDITVGQMVWTLEAAAMPVRWVSSTTVAGRGAFAPVVIQPGVIGNDTPLTVSQQHRIRVTSAMADLMFGKPDVLVAAKHLVGLPGVDIQECDTITYTHFMFDNHQIVRANGALAESFFWAETAVNALEDTQRAELEALFPSLAAGYDRFGVSAAMTLTGREAAALRPYLTA